MIRLFLQVLSRIQELEAIFSIKAQHIFLIVYIYYYETATSLNVFLNN